ncbi:MAG: succinate dehydrogenase/fumarate reductase iron-sulfur subunit [Campylobacterales bacterium]
MEKKIVDLTVFRFNAETDYWPYYKKYKVEASEDSVVLDLLNQIKWEQDGSFAYRRSCRHGICGSCAIKVNNKATLACKERVFDLVELFGSELTIDPQDKRRAVKDMIIDKKDFWDKYAYVKPYLQAEISEHPSKENIVLKDDAEKIDDADYCIQCGACYYSCPSNEINGKFLGPAALAKTYRFVADSRDGDKKQRLKDVNLPDSGIWDCVKCYECAQACPKDVNPIEKITRLHTQSFVEKVADMNVATRHAVGFLNSIQTHGNLDEGTLVLYSERFGAIKNIREAISMLTHKKIKMPWNTPKSKNHDEVKTLIKNSRTVKV